MSHRAFVSSSTSFAAPRPLLAALSLCLLVGLLIACDEESSDAPDVGTIDDVSDTDAAHSDVSADTVAPDVPDEPREEPLRVMTYNLRYANSDIDEWESRRDLLVQSVLTTEPDLLGVQEADAPWMEWLPAALPDYAYVGVGRDDGDADGEFAAIFYRTDKYTLRDSGTFWLSETPTEPSFGWGANNRRICTWAEFSANDTGAVFVHYNTHLDHESSEARTNGTTLLLETIAAADHPAILTGDMNFPQDSTQYDRIEESPLADTKLAADDTMSHGTINWFSSIDSRVVIDFVFADEAAFDVERYRVLTDAEFDGTPVSDHYPVVADLVVRSQEN